jgi:hypothetical protein
MEPSIEGSTTSAAALSDEQHRAWVDALRARLVLVVGKPEGEPLTREDRGTLAEIALGAAAGAMHPDTLAWFESNDPGRESPVARYAAACGRALGGCETLGETLAADLIRAGSILGMKALVAMVDLAGGDVPAGVALPGVRTDRVAAGAVVVAPRTRRAPDRG